MSFKISNSTLQEANREAVSYHGGFEKVTGVKTHNPSIPTTQVTLSGSYPVTLPKGTIGERKMVTVVGGSGECTVSYNNGWNGNSNTTGLSTVGDTIMFYATVNGWHHVTWLD
jgi:hypothetical protein